jgi:hypothetical protein
VKHHWELYFTDNLRILQGKGAQLNPRALGSFYIASYDSQSYGGVILTRLHTGSDLLDEHLTAVCQSQSCITTDGQS